MPGIMNPSRILAIILLLLVPYLYIRRYHAQKVPFPLKTSRACAVRTNFRASVLIPASQAGALYAKQHNCQPLKTLPYKWPFGLDLLWAAYHHATEGRILQFFSTLMETVPSTFEQKLLGVNGVVTVEPKNLEAVLGTQFPGISI